MSITLDFLIFEAISSLGGRRLAFPSLARRPSQPQLDRRVVAGSASRSGQVPVSTKEAADNWLEPVSPGHPTRARLFPRRTRRAPLPILPHLAITHPHITGNPPLHRHSLARELTQAA